MAAASPIPVVKIRDTFDGSLTTIVDPANHLKGEVQVGGAFNGGFVYTSTNDGPDWTTFNQSDPGLTLIELFAFLSENLLFRANQIPERGRRASLTLTLTQDLHVVEPCGGSLASSVAIPFDLCLRLEFFNAGVARDAAPTSVFDLAQWNTARFLLFPMAAATSSPDGKGDTQSTANTFLVAGTITHTTTTLTSVPGPGTFLLLTSALAAFVAFAWRRNRRSQRPPAWTRT